MNDEDDDLHRRTTSFPPPPPSRPAPRLTCSPSVSSANFFDFPSSLSRIDSVDYDALQAPLTDLPFPVASRHSSLHLPATLPFVTDPFLPPTFTPSPVHRETISSQAATLALVQYISERNGFDRFMNFLQKEYSEENLLFWQACEEVRAIWEDVTASPASDSTKELLEKIKLYVLDIWKEFLSADAQKPINIPGTQLKDMGTKMQPLLESKDGTGRKALGLVEMRVVVETLLLTQDTVLDLMAADSWQRFRVRSLTTTKDRGGTIQNSAALAEEERMKEEYRKWLEFLEKLEIKGIAEWTEEDHNGYKQAMLVIKEFHRRKRVGSEDGAQRKGTRGLFLGISMKRQQLMKKWSRKALVMSKKRRKILELLRAGKAAYKKKRYEDAKTHFTNVLSLDENHAVALANRSMTYFNLKQYPRAVEDALKATIVDPRYATGYIRLGLAYMAQQVFDQAQEAFQKALELESENEEARQAIFTISKMKGSKALMVGYLLKKGTGALRRWKYRFFELYDDALVWNSPSKKDKEKENSEHEGVIALKTITNIKSDENKKHFTIQHQNGKCRLKAHNTISRDQWVSAIRSCVQNCHESELNGSTSSGGSKDEKEPEEGVLSDASEEDDEHGRGQRVKSPAKDEISFFDFLDELAAKAPKKSSMTRQDSNGPSTSDVEDDSEDMISCWEALDELNTKHVRVPVVQRSNPVRLVPEFDFSLDTIARLQRNKRSFFQSISESEAEVLYSSPSPSSLSSLSSGFSGSPRSPILGGGSGPRPPHKYQLSTSSYFDSPLLRPMTPMTPVSPATKQAWPSSSNSNSPIRNTRFSDLRITPISPATPKTMSLSPTTGGTTETAVRTSVFRPPIRQSRIFYPNQLPGASSNSAASSPAPRPSSTSQSSVSRLSRSGPPPKRAPPPLPTSTSSPSSLSSLRFGEPASPLTTPRPLKTVPSSPGPGPSRSPATKFQPPKNGGTNKASPSSPFVLEPDSPVKQKNSASSNHGGTNSNSSKDKKHTSSQNQNNKQGAGLGLLVPLPNIKEENGDMKQQQQQQQQVSKSPPLSTRSVLRGSTGSASDSKRQHQHTGSTDSNSSTGSLEERLLLKGEEKSFSKGVPVMVGFLTQDKKSESEWYELYLNGLYNAQGLEIILWKDIYTVTNHGTHSINLTSVREKKVLLSTRSIDLRDKWMQAITTCLRAINKETALRELTEEEIKEKEKEKELSTHLVAGLASYKRQEWDEALDCFTSAIALGRRHLGAYCNRALVYIKLDQLEHAKRDALTAIEIDPSYGKGHLRLAQVYCALNDFEHAEQSIETAIKLEPSGEAMKVREEIRLEKRKKSMITEN